MKKLTRNELRQVKGGGCTFLSCCMAVSSICGNLCFMGDASACDIIQFNPDCHYIKEQCPPPCHCPVT